MGPSASGWIIEVSSFQGLLIITWVWPITKINDVMRPVTSQVRHMEAANRKCSSSSALVEL